MADKTKTIKTASDNEIDELIIRLRKENQVQDLISDLKRKSTPHNSFGEPLPYGSPEVSTEEPIESLYHKADDVLAHFGIMGMKWGVRREPGANGRVGSGGTERSNARKAAKVEKKIQKQIADDFKKEKELRKKGYKNLSTKELKELTQRMQLEKQLRELTVSDTTKGMEVVKAITGVGTTVAALYAVSQTPLGQAIKKGITQHKYGKQLSIFD